MEIHCKVIGLVGERIITMSKLIEELLQEKLVITLQKENPEHKHKIIKQKVVVSTSYQGKWKVLP